MKNWYVLQVLTGGEIDVQAALEQTGYQTMVLFGTRLVRSRGRWIEETKLLMPGYVFVELELTGDAWHHLNSIPKVIRILSAGQTPSPLEAHETKWLRLLEAHAKSVSDIEFLDSHTYIVRSGALMLLQDNITGINRHKRRAQVMITVAGHKHRLALSFRPVN